jgi:hypothetical protein
MGRISFASTMVCSVIKRSLRITSSSISIYLRPMHSGIPSPNNKAQSCSARNTPQCLRDAVIMSIQPCPGSRHSSVGTVTGYGSDSRGSIPGRVKRFSPAPQRPDWPWGPPSLLSNWFRGALSLRVKWPGSEADRLPHQVLRSRMVELYLTPPHVFLT